MNAKERAFVHEYIINKGNAYQAALKAGYSKETARQAYRWVTTDGYKGKNGNKPDVVEAIEKELAKIESEKIADEIEIMQYLTSVMRKETMAEVVVVEGVGDGLSKAKLIEKTPDEKEATKAAETLAKIHGMFNQNITVDIAPIVLEGYEDVPD